MERGKASWVSTHKPGGSRFTQNVMGNTRGMHVHALEKSDVSNQ